MNEQTRQLIKGFVAKAQEAAREKGTTMATIMTSDEQTLQSLGFTQNGIATINKNRGIVFQNLFRY